LTTKFGPLVISVDPDIVAAGVNAIMPGVEEASVTRSVAAAWVLLFSVAPCAYGV
jgi:hypothetical protein